MYQHYANIHLHTDVMYQPRSSVWTTRISLGFMINAGLLLTSSRRLIFGVPVTLSGHQGRVCLLSSEKLTLRPGDSLVSETGMLS